MLDIKFIRENPKLVKEKSLQKGIDIDIDKLLKLDEEYKKILIKIENLRAKKNKASKKIALAKKEKDRKNEEKLIKEMREIDKQTDELEPKLKKLEEKIYSMLLYIPNLPFDDVPIGKDETENMVIRKWGEPTRFDFKPKDHIELGKKLDLIDIEAGAKVSGSRFYFLKNEAVLLEFAIINFVFDLLRKEGFIPIITPALVNRRTMLGGGYLPKGEEEIYKTQDDLYLIGTSEQPITAYHADEILDEKDLPKRYVGFSSCFRREAGSYGKDVKGILRVHQFDKIEMYSFCLPEKSREEHLYLLSMEEKIVQALKIPYQVVRMCTGDLGMTAADKYDIECWMPGQGRYRETHSTSNCTDFQARRLNIKYRPKIKNQKSKIQYIHTLNGTAVAIGRMIIAILENYQQKDGSIIIPEVLRRYLGFDKIESK